jgi:tetratricopeptide (TPR) repeat protein
MTGLGAGGGATCASTSRHTREHEPRPPPVRRESARATPKAAPSGLRHGMDRVARVAEGWRSVKLDEIEPVSVVGGRLLWRPLRRTLDVGAFGINAYVAPKAGDDVVEEHTEQTLGHEEVYVVLAGHAIFTLDDETLDAPAGTVVFIRDPKVKRHARAEEPDTAVLAVGGPRGGAYEPSAWEDVFLAERHRTFGDFEEMATELSAALERRPDHPSLLYNLACAEALAGRADAALEHLRRALELKSEWAEMALKDEDLASLRFQSDWPVTG